VGREPLHLYERECNGKEPGTQGGSGYDIETGGNASRGVGDHVSVERRVGGTFWGQEIQFKRED